MCGAGATTWKPCTLEAWPSGLVTFTVQLSALVETLMVICTSVLLMKLSSPAVRAFDDTDTVTLPVGGLANRDSLTETVWVWFDAVSGGGLGLLVAGGAVGAFT